MKEEPKVKIIPYKDTFLTLMNYKEPLKTIEGGFGYHGCLLSTQDGTKVQCAICGGLYSELSKHLTAKHKMTSREYKEKFGLAYQTSLISEDIREKRKQVTLRWIKEMEKKHGMSWREILIKNSKKGNENRGKGRFQPKIQLETKNKRGTCPDQLLDRVKKMAEELGHTPSKKEFIDATGTQRYVHLIYTTFGSWTKALEMLGMQPKDNKGNKSERGLGRNEYTDEYLLEMLDTFYKTNNKIPTETDCRRGLLPASDVFRRHFGSLPKARELAGIYDIPTRYGVIKG